MITREKGYRICEWLCMTVILVMSLFIIVENSPLFQNVNMDSAIFLSIGQGITEGKVPYVDITENKGPLFFLMMAIPQLFVSGTTGVYVLETLILLGSCWLIMRMVRWMTPEKRHPLLLLIPLMWFVANYSGHNFCEEYDLFFTLIGAAVMVHAFTEQEKGSKWRSFWLGVATMSVLLIKMSDILTLGVTVLFYIGYACRKKNFLREAGGFLAGMAVVGVPVCGYLLSVGAFGAMIQEYIVNNIVHVLLGKNHGFWNMRMYMIRSAYGTQSILPVCMMLASLLLVRFIQPSEERKKPMEKSMRWYLAAIAVSNLLIGYISSSGFSQHLTLGKVTEVLALLLLLRAVWQRLIRMGLARRILIGRYAVALAVGVVFLVNWVSVTDLDGVVHDESYQEQLAYYREFREDLEDYEDSLFTIGVSPCWYWYNGYYPAYPYYNIKGFIVDNVGMNQAEDFEVYLLDNPISAILISGEIEDLRGILTDETIDYLHENYYVSSECSRGELQLLLHI